ncbi:MAG: OstA-like protein [Alistipes sp.]|nr:OstA-like protein [Alistipes sp.]
MIQKQRLWGVIIAATLWCGGFSLSGRQPETGAPHPASAAAKPAKPATPPASTPTAPPSTPAAATPSGTPPAATPPATPSGNAESNPQTATVDYRADVMTSLRIADSTALCLVGHVVFYHNGAVITCDSAIRYNDRMMDCYRNVVVNKDSTFVYGDKATYNGLLNEARIYSPMIKMVDKDATFYTFNFIYNTLTSIGRYFGGGVMTQKENQMESYEGYYYSKTRELEGIDRVQMRNPQYRIKSDSVTYNMDSEVATFKTVSYIWNDKNEFLTAQRGRYDNKEQQYTFTDNSYILTADQEVWADTIFYQQPSQNAILRNNVQIVDNKQQAMAFGDYARYWGDTQQALLTRNPSVLSYEEGKAEGAADTMYMRSDTLFIYTVNRFKKDSVDSIPPTPEVLDSLPPQNHPVDSLAADSLAGTAALPATRPGVTPTDSTASTAHDSIAPATEGSTPQAPKIASDSTGTSPADSTMASSPTDSLGDSLAKAPTAKDLKRQQKELVRQQKAAELKVKDEARAAKIKAKAQARREKAAASDAEFQRQERERERKELARRFMKGRATSADSAALLRLDSLEHKLKDSVEVVAHDSVSVKATKPLSSTLDSTAVAATDTLSRDSLVRIVRGYRNVRIFRSDFQAVCDSIVGFSLDSTVHMYIQPVLWNEVNQVTAEVIDLFTRNQTLEKAIFKGDPLMCSQIDTSHFDQVRGKEITAYFSQGEVQKMDVNGNAETYYFMEEGDSTHKEITGFLVAESSNLTFQFTDKTVSDIIYRRNPAYVIYPMDQIPETQSLVMKGVSWQIDRRPSRAQVFDRTIRPSQREYYERLPQSTFPIAQSMTSQRELLKKRGWVDRNDRYLGSIADDFVRTLLGQ